jgi:type IV pilus assembly protein PilB
VRIICPNCKRPKKHSEAELRDSGIDPSTSSTYNFAEGAGCLECSGTGFHGRTAICELLDLSDRIREMIVDRRPTSEIKRAAIEEGMITLRQSALTKVQAGVSTLREVNKVTFVE